MYCNGDLFAKKGVRPPATWDELVDTARALALPNGERWGHEVPISWWFWVALVLGVLGFIGTFPPVFEAFASE